MVPWIVYILMGINSLMFMLCPFKKLPLSLDAMALVPSEMVNFSHWPRVVTSMFAHGNLLHLAFNMFALHRFGAPLERSIGHWNLLLIYLLSGIGSNVLYSLLHGKSSVGLVGASAGISGILAVYFLRFSQTRDMTNFLIYQLVGLTMYTQSGISYSSHLYGFLIGALYYFMFDGEKMDKSRFIK